MATNSDQRKLNMAPGTIKQRARSKSTSRKTIFYDNFVLFWTCQSKHSCQFGCIIPNIHIVLDHFPITLDIFCHFGQYHKRPCFLLVKRLVLALGDPILMGRMWLDNLTMNTSVSTKNLKLLRTIFAAAIRLEGTNATVMVSLD